MIQSKHTIAVPPGATIREQLADRDMSQKEFASRMGLSQKHISQLINGEVRLTPDVAVRLESVLGIPAQFWNNLEAIYQEKLIKDAEKAAARQKEQEAEKEEPRKPMGFIAVSIGEGMNEIFRGLGADYLIEGGQTMNPSTEDMLAAIDHVNADHIFILPNNKNIIMAANQAAELTEDKDIIVLPTKTIPQGIVALVNYIPDYTAEENKEAMLAELDSVKTGQVTYAVRDTEIDGMQIRQNDYMGIGDKAILAVGTDLKETTMKMIDAMVDEDSAIVSIYYGADETEEHAQEIGKMIEEKYPDVEVEINCGGQPIYYFVISVE